MAVLVSLIEHHACRGDVSSAERCLLLLDVRNLDFDQLLPLLKRHRMHSALCHVYSRGMGDLTTPLRTLLHELVTVRQCETSFIYITCI
jgi:hypothetical protein